MKYKYFDAYDMTLRRSMLADGYRRYKFSSIVLGLALVASSAALVAWAAVSSVFSRIWRLFPLSLIASSSVAFVMLLLCSPYVLYVYRKHGRDLLDALDASDAEMIKIMERDALCVMFDLFKKYDVKTHDVQRCSLISVCQNLAMMLLKNSNTFNQDVLNGRLLRIINNPSWIEHDITTYSAHVHSDINAQNTAHCVLFFLIASAVLGNKSVHRYFAPALMVMVMVFSTFSMCAFGFNAYVLFRSRLSINALSCAASIAFVSMLLLVFSSSLLVKTLVFYRNLNSQWDGKSQSVLTDFRESFAYGSQREDKQKTLGDVRAVVCGDFLPKAEDHPAPAQHEDEVQDSSSRGNVMASGALALQQDEDTADVSCEDKFHKTLEGGFSAEDEPILKGDITASYSALSKAEDHHPAPSQHEHEVQDSSSDALLASQLDKDTADMSCEGDPNKTLGEDHALSTAALGRRCHESDFNEDEGDCGSWWGSDFSDSARDPSETYHPAPAQHEDEVQGSSSRGNVMASGALALQQDEDTADVSCEDKFHKTLEGGFSAEDEPILKGDITASYSALSKAEDHHPAPSQHEHEVQDSSSDALLASQLDKDTADMSCEGDPNKTLGEDHALSAAALGRRCHESDFNEDEGDCGSWWGSDFSDSARDPSETLDSNCAASDNVLSKAEEPAQRDVQDSVIESSHGSVKTLDDMSSKDKPNRSGDKKSGRGGFLSRFRSGINKKSSKAAEFLKPGSSRKQSSEANSTRRRLTASDIVVVDSETGLLAGQMVDRCPDQDISNLKCGTTSDDLELQQDKDTADVLCAGERSGDKHCDSMGGADFEDEDKFSWGSDFEDEDFGVDEPRKTLDSNCAASDNVLSKSEEPAQCDVQDSVIESSHGSVKTLDDMSSKDKPNRSGDKKSGKGGFLSKLSSNINQKSSKTAEFLKPWSSRKQSSEANSTRRRLTASDIVVDKGTVLLLADQMVDGCPDQDISDPKCDILEKKSSESKKEIKSARAGSEPKKTSFLTRSFNGKSKKEIQGPNKQENTKVPVLWAAAADPLSDTQKKDSIKIATDEDLLDLGFNSKAL